jgi:hypothetical protein
MYFTVIIFIMPTAKYLLMSCHILIYMYIVSKYIHINVSNRKEIGDVTAGKVEGTFSGVKLLKHLEMGAVRVGDPRRHHSRSARFGHPTTQQPKIAWGPHQA